jgi:hypothetical protein
VMEAKTELHSVDFCPGIMRYLTLRVDSGLSVGETRESSVEIGFRTRVRQLSATCGPANLFLDRSRITPYGSVWKAVCAFPTGCELPGSPS